MNDDFIGAYKELPYSIWRTANEDTMRLGRSRSHIPILLEVDITEANAALARRKRQGGKDVTFTAWACTCIARAASEYPRVHAICGRHIVGSGILRHLQIRPRTIVTFSDVDMSLAVDRRLAGNEAGDRVPMPFVMRKVNEKNPEELTEEIRAAKSRPLPADQQWLSQVTDRPPPWLVRLGFAGPAWLRDRFYWNRLLSNPLRVKSAMGTVMVTSLPFSTGSGTLAWGVPVGIHPLVVALGAIGRRFDLIKDDENVSNEKAGETITRLHVAPRCEPRDVLCMTVLFDHDVIDGLPVARFLRRLSSLMENGFGL